MRQLQGRFHCPRWVAADRAPEGGLPGVLRSTGPARACRSTGWSVPATQPLAGVVFARLLLDSRDRVCCRRPCTDSDSKHRAHSFPRGVLLHLLHSLDGASPQVAGAGASSRKREEVAPVMPSDKSYLSDGRLAQWQSAVLIRRGSQDRSLERLPITLRQGSFWLLQQRACVLPGFWACERFLGVRLSQRPPSDRSSPCSHP
jgi:hypothetical protein